MIIELHDILIEKDNWKKLMVLGLQDGSVIINTSIVSTFYITSSESSRNIIFSCGTRCQSENSFRFE